MAQVLLIYLSSHCLVVIHRSPAQLKAEIKQLCYITVICTMSCSRKGDFCNRQEVYAFINMNDQGYRTLSCVEMLFSKVGLNFHTPPAFHFVIKGGVIQRCCWVFAQLALIYCMNIRIFTVTSVLLFW